jgi:hypothetical protein
VTAYGRGLSRVAGLLIAVSIATGIMSIVLRAGSAGSLTLRLFEAMTLLLAALAYLFYVLAHHSERGQVLTRLILVAAFALWAIVQLAPNFSGAAVINDLAILLFVVDLAIVLSPAR